MDTEELRKLLDEATPGPWETYGSDPWELTVNYEPQGRVCFLAHSSGLNDERDFANARLIALAPTLARKVIAAEKLAEAVRGISFSDNGIDLSKALAAWEAAQ